MMRAVVRAATRRATSATAVVRPTSAAAVWQKSYAVRVMTMTMTMTMTMDEAWKCVRCRERETDDETRGVVGCAHFIQFRCVGGSARREQRE